MTALAAPALFDLEPVGRPRTLTPHTVPFTRWQDELCALCRKPIGRLSWSHGCGGACAEGRYVVCDDCAPDDLNPTTGRSHWGITREYLELDRLRRRIYTAGGGETEMRAALAAVMRDGRQNVHDAPTEKDTTIDL